MEERTPAELAVEPPVVDAVSGSVMSGVVSHLTQTEASLPEIDDNIKNSSFCHPSCGTQGPAYGICIQSSDKP